LLLAELVADALNTGQKEICWVGLVVGAGVARATGRRVGGCDGNNVGRAEGSAVGSSVGLLVGNMVGRRPTRAPVIITAPLHAAPPTHPWANWYVWHGPRVEKVMLAPLPQLPLFCASWLPLRSSRRSRMGPETPGPGDAPLHVPAVKVWKGQASMKHVAVLTVAPLVPEALNCRQKPNKFEGSAVGCTTGAMDGRGSEGLAEARGRLVRGAFVCPRSVGRGVGRRVRVAVGGLVAPVTVGRGVLVGRRVRVTVGGFVAPGTVGWGVRRCVRRAVGVLVGRCVGGMDPFPCAMSTFAMKQLAGVAQGDEAKTCTRGKAGARLFEAMLV